MRLTSVVLTTSGSLEDVEFSLKENQSPSRYTVRSIVGIDAEELIPKFYSHGLQSGSSFYEYQMKPREIAMRVALNPQYRRNETASDIRDRIYRLISSSRNGMLQIQFKDGGSVVGVISGAITKMEAAHFSKLPELQITFLCPDPMIRSVHPVDYDVADLPSANPVVLPDGISTAPHGFTFKVEFTGLVTTFTIQDDPTDPEWKFEVVPLGGFISGDELWFSSEYAAKELYMVRPGDNRYLMDRVSDGSVWPTIFPGNNRLYFMNIANFDWLELRYYSAYWGV